MNHRISPRILGREILRTPAGRRILCKEYRMDTKALKKRLTLALSGMPLLAAPALSACDHAPKDSEVPLETTVVGDEKTQVTEETTAQTDENTDSTIETTEPWVQSTPQVWCNSVKEAYRISVNRPTTNPSDVCEYAIDYDLLNNVTEGESGVDVAGYADPSVYTLYNDYETSVTRDNGDEDACCYSVYAEESYQNHYYYEGRPLFERGETLAAPVSAGRAWLSQDPKGLCEEALLHPRARAALSLTWSYAAQMEHASVASFARATLELMAIGAPPELIAGYQRASIEEIGHAQLCFTLASAYAGTHLQPGPLPSPGPRAQTLLGLALDTFAEGCVEETLAALRAQRALRTCQIPALRNVLEVIAREEADHAALAWSTLGWVMRTADEGVRHAIRRHSEFLYEKTLRDQEPRRALDDALTPELAARHGVLLSHEIAQTHRDAWERVIRPLLTDDVDG